MRDASDQASSSERGLRAVRERARAANVAVVLTTARSQAPDALAADLGSAELALLPFPIDRAERESTHTGKDESCVGGPAAPKRLIDLLAKNGYGIERSLIIADLAWPDDVSALSALVSDPRWRDLFAIAPLYLRIRTKGADMPAGDRLLLLMAGRGMLPAARASITAGSPGITVYIPFEPRGYAVRLATSADLPALSDLERACWSQVTQMPEALLRRRIGNLPAGNCVLVANGKIRAAVFAQRVADAAVRGLNAETIHRKAVLDGPLLQLLALNVSPDWQDRQLGDQLLEFTLQRAEAMVGVERVIGVTRCKDRARHPDIAMADYVMARDEFGRPLDPVLAFHHAHGARIVGPVPDYRPLDAENEGYGVLVSYDALEDRADHSSASVGDAPIGVPAPDLRAVVLGAVRAVLAGGEVDLSAPLFDLGLDSADLLGLNDRIARAAGFQLPASFFFEFNTVEKIVAELERRATVADGSSASAASAGTEPRSSKPVLDGDPSRAIAIVGMACRLPGGIETLEDFQRLLFEGRAAISHLPEGRFTWPAGVDLEGDQKGIDRGGFLPDIARFDPALFRISPRDAMLMDPQQRMALELAYACFEDAGRAPKSLCGSRTGVFIGASSSDFQLRLTEQPPAELEDRSALGTSMAVLANRLSYVFDLDGPSMVLDTACSSSLVALHEAVRALRSGACEIALVAGINIICHPANSLAYHAAGMLSPNGRCATFDAAADGYVRGEGGVALLLKPLAAAIRDGDRIDAVIRGTAINHGGQGGGLTVPNPVRQGELVRAALEDAEVEPSSIGYVEAHGTGTALGDPVEMRGLARVFAGTPVSHEVAIGSVKTNLGHLEAAAGLVGLTKVVLMLKRGELAPSLNFETPSPHIPWAELPFRVVTWTEPWVVTSEGETPPVPRRACVSSFGSGGTNAHAVVEEYPECPHALPPSDEGALLVLSARTEDTLRRLAGRLVAHIDAAGLTDHDLPDMARALRSGRDAMACRAAFVAHGMDEAHTLLDALARSQPHPMLHVGTPEGHESPTTDPAADPQTPAETARAWVHGRLETLPPERGRRRPPLRLPPYPFATDCYWPFRDIAASPPASPTGVLVRAEPTDPISESILGFVAVALGMPPELLRADSDVIELGLDSIGSVKLQRSIEQAFGIVIPASELVELGSAQKITEAVANRSRETGCSTSTRSGTEAEPAGDRPRLSEGQRALWALQASVPESAVYNIPLKLRFTEQIAAEDLTTAAHALARRFPELFIAVEVGEAGPEARPLPLDQFSVDILDDSSPQEAFQARAAEPIDLGVGPLLRASAAVTSEGTEVLFVLHHLGFDAGSIPPFLAALMEELEAAHRTGLAADGAPSWAFSHFAAWQRQAAARHAASRTHFAERLANRPPAPVLPLHTDQGPAGIAGGVLCRRLSTESHGALHRRARDLRITPATLLLAVFTQTMADLSGSQDLVCGVTTSLRDAAGVANGIGYFVNVVPVRLAADGDWPTLMRRTASSLAADLDYAAYPLSALVRELDLGRAMPFEIAFNFQSASLTSAIRHLEAAYADRLPFELTDEMHQAGAFPLELEILDEADGARLRFKYDRGAVAPDFVERVATLFETHLADACGQAPIRESESGTAKPRNLRPIHEIIAQNAANEPERTAVVSPSGETLSYRELDERSRVLAQRLAASGVGRGTLVGVRLDRDLCLPVALLAVLRAGAAYVPLDPDYPAERRRMIADDADLPVVLHTQNSWDGLAAASADAARRAIAIQPDGRIESDGTEVAPAAAGPDDPAYVMYTSGSTGRPKGVVIPHRALANVLHHMVREAPGLTPDDRLLAVTPFGFDISAFELFGPLLVGACVVLADRPTVRDPERLRERIARSGATVMQSTPSLWSGLFAAGWENVEGVRIVCGGEPLSTALRQQIIATGARAFNMYGPTETTIWSTAQRIALEEPDGIGRPIANTTVLILDAEGRVVADGETGELCIAGTGLATGYLERPDLTAARFAPHDAVGGERLYRTGDLARLRPDGTIDCLGRIDGQIKLHGHRIELGEIETVLAEHPSILQAAALVLDAVADGPPRRLGAAVRLRAGAVLDPSSLRRHLAARLPAAMVPAEFVPVVTLPLTPNGKLDRLALASVFLSQEHGPMITLPAKAATPDPAIRTALHEIWRRTLGHAEFTETDGFFEVGGDSVSAVVLATRISERFGIPFSVTALFRHPTIQAAQAYLEERRATDAAQDVASSSFAGQATSPSPAMAPVPEPDRLESIAIVGMSCVLPGAEGIGAFWQNLCAGISSIEVPDAAELAAEGIDPSILARADFVGARACIAGKDLFDPAFFKLSPVDAERMHPQARLLLMHAWAAVEDAGYAASAVPRTGVYVSAGHTAYGPSASSAMEAARVLNRVEDYHAWLLSQPGTLPTMISHRLGFEGPSYFLHSNCSSSLAALDLASRALRSGEIDHALVGAATLLTDWNHGYVHQEGLNFSPDGKLRAFDAEARGMVGGEGVAAILLKRTEDALRDRDHIYATVEAVAVNNDGTRKAGYYAPSVAGQSAVVAQAMAQAQVQPRDVAFVEAHGTGTALGDPIEIAALAEAFEADAHDRAPCAIGSVKSSIGHLDTAAGLAGLIKTALALKARLLPKTLGIEAVNPALKLDETPFVIATEAVDLLSRPAPLIAGVSCFGIGGTNAHAVLKEAPPVHECDDDAASPCLVPLSARSQDRLDEAVRNLLAFLDHMPDGAAALLGRPIRLKDLAFTLQVGREAMPARAAFVVSSLEELREALRIYGADGVRPSGRSDPARFTDEPASRDMLDQTAREGRLDTIAEGFLRGATINWSLLPGNATARRVSLPTYPFARERYWVSDAPQLSSARTERRLHPLVHENVSDLWSAKFASAFSGTEPFLRDHVAGGQKVLPGVAYLEMARHAIAGAVPDRQDSKTLVLLDTLWKRPLVADGEAVDVVVTLDPLDEDEVLWSAASPGIVEGKPDGLFAEGRAVFRLSTPPAALDIAAIRARCPERLEGSACYAHFNRLGFDYGPTLRALSAVHRQAGADSEVLADFTLPESALADAGAYILHPGILDAALQSVIGFDRTLGSGTAPRQATMPFSLESVEIYSPPPHAGVVHVRRAASAGAIAKFDLDIVGLDGMIAVSLRGFTSRPMRREKASEAGRIKGGSEFKPATLLYAARPVETPLEQEARRASAAASRLLLIGTKARCDAVAAAIRQKLRDATVITVATDERPVPEAFQEAAETLLDRTRQAMAERGAIQLVVLEEGPAKLFEGLAGILRTARLESPDLATATIRLDADLSDEEIAKMIVAERQTRGEVLRSADRRSRLAWQEIRSAADDAAPWKDGGVYWITGGLGGLGLLFAEEIAGSVRHPVLVLSSRNPADERTNRRIAAMEALGAVVERLSLDVTDAVAVAAAAEGIRSKHGRIDTVLHAAGLVRDGLILRKRVEEARTVLAPKVAGTLNLDAATRRDTLDHFIVFSSGSGALGNVGQADYAAANAFLDAFAGRRDAMVEAGLRTGRTLSIAWPLWTDGGMQVPAEMIEARRHEGQEPLATAEGLAAFRRALASGETRLLVLSGDRERLEEKLLGTSTPATDEGPGDRFVQREGASPTPVSEASDLAAHATLFLASKIAIPLKLPAERIDPDAPLEDYGIDSLTAVQLVVVLEQSFGPLSKTLFFEYQTLRDLADYFAERHGARVEELVGRSAEAARPIEPPAPVDEPRRAPGRLTRHVPASLKETPPAPEAPDIAIIGLAGRFPGARNIEEYWQNLAAGRDCITEIPRERWDHSRYFDPDKNAPGKIYSKWGGFIDGADEFDPLFFNIAPREAERIDPQERLFLQCAYEAIENAGYTREALSAGRGRETRVGVYVGVMYSEYQLFGAQAQVRDAPVTMTGSPASIANRVSYFCNFNGPSLGVDTMCSSSLTALHLACRDIREGCDYAIAGGVNLSIHPNKYLFLSQFGFVSSQGRCASFGEGGDGYVPGEGVGAVLLKRLDRALADGDTIWGIVKASALNHGGKTNGYTVPNPIAQGLVVERALREAGVDPAHISYLEAHGTGTSLGDPIEITGLSRAFEARAKECGSSLRPGACAIGSAKSNIGHLESAAGIAGLAKVLLQMREKTLVPSLHADTLNPHIDFAATPFTVQRALAEWQRPVLANGRPIPRIAGISSFGAGGANAHVVIEEFDPDRHGAHRPQVPARVTGEPVLLVLSARSQERLLQKAQDLLDHIEARRLSDHDLAALAYTLQVGREAMDARLAFTATAMAGLIQRLKDVLGQQSLSQGNLGPDAPEAAGQTSGDATAVGSAAASSVLTGHARRDREALAPFRSDPDFAELLARWIERRRLTRLAELWVKGLDLDFNQLHTNPKPNKINLPSYPFEREVYRHAEAHDRGPGSVPTATGGGAKLHPLVHRNVSNAAGLAFETSLNATDPWLADHKVGGVPTLSGAAQLEMAVAAAQLIEPGDVSQDTPIELTNVLWLAPVGAKEARALRLKIDPASHQWSLAAAGGDGAVRFSEGRFRTASDLAPGMLHVAALEAASVRELDPSLLMDTFAARGIVYGPSHRTIRRISILGEQKGALVALDARRIPQVDRRSLTVGADLLDGAFQATLALDLAEGCDRRETMLPFALDRFIVQGALPDRCLAHVREISAKGGSRRFDLDLSDRDGRICVSVRGLACRAIRGAPSDEGNHWSGSGRLLTELWEPVKRPCEQTIPAGGTALVIGGSDSEITALRNRFDRLARFRSPDEETIAPALAEALAPDEIVWIVAGSSQFDVFGGAAGTEGQVASALGLVKRLIDCGAAGRPLRWTVATRFGQAASRREQVDPRVAAIHGFIGSMAKEFAPLWQVRLVDRDTQGPDGIDRILALPFTQDGAPKLLRHGEVLERHLVETALAPLDGALYRPGRTYLVVGGAGGLGEVWSEHVMRHFGARLIWLGRREIDVEIQAKLDRLARIGQRPLYVSADAANPSSLASARERIEREAGPLHGIVHSSLVLDDASLMRLDGARLRRAFASKAATAAEVTRAFAGTPLDFTLFFSSTMSLDPEAGQASYAAGCAFADAFAQELARVAPYAVKVMNWGWWGSVGRVASSDYRARMERRGLASIEPNEGMAALDAVLASGVDRAAYVKRRDWTPVNPMSAPSRRAPARSARRSILTAIEPTKENA